MSLYSDVAFTSRTKLDLEELNRRMKLIADAIETLREFEPDWTAQVDALRTVALERINTALLPVFQQVVELSNLGALLSSTSTSSVEIGAGTKSFIVPAAKRRNFAPTALLMVYANDNFDLAMIGSTQSYDVETGELVVLVTRFRGTGTFANWDISPIATTDDLEALRTTILTKAAEADADAATATTKAAQATAARDETVTLTNAFKQIYWGGRTTPPPTTPATAENGRYAIVGSQYFDTSITPATVKVFNGTGWAPAVSVSIGGSRQQLYTTPTAGQTIFPVDGGFTSGWVNVNGAVLFSGKGVTLEPQNSRFILDNGVSASDVVAFVGYLANNALDIYTKQEIDNGFYTKGQVDAVFANYYTKTASDARYYTKTTADSLLAAKQAYNDNLRDLSINPTGTNKIDLLFKLGPVHGGEAPEPAGAGVGMVNGDFNTVTVPGVYTIAGNWNNGPSGNANHTGLLVVHARRFNNAFYQEYFYSSDRRFVRFSGDGTTWGPWRAQSIEAVGTVSQSSGIPTGAVIERGSNANGEYVKFADGTMIAWTRMQITPAVADWSQIRTEVQLFYLGTTVDWVFPIAFTGTPVTNATSDYFTWMRSASGFNSTKCRYELVRETAQSRTYNLAYLAIGRWY